MNKFGSRPTICFNLHRDAGDRQIVAQGRIGSITSSLALSYEPWELSQGYLLWLGSDEKPGYFSLSEAVRARVAGQALVIGDLIIAENAFLEVDSGLTLTGELLGEGELEPLPTFAATPDSRELWSWLQQSLLVAGEPPPQPLAGTLYLESGVTYECLSADWTDLQVIGPREDEPAATLIVRGDLHWQSCVGHINLLVAGDCWQPTEPSGRLMLDGVLWVQGHLDVHNLQVRGALIAGSLEVHADLLPGWNLTVEQFPGQVSGAGLVVPKVKAWEYLFE